MTTQFFPVHLRGTDIVTTRLGFGCASLMRLPSRSQRRVVLDAAWDAGIRHFDVARLYGLGATEKELGEFARDKREKIIIATKFGLEPSSAAGRLAPIQGVARWVLARVPGLRRHVRRRTSALNAEKRFDATSARRSLETSLRALQTDRIDLLLLHEPEIQDIRGTDTLEFLESACGQGLIRAWGIAGYPRATREVALAHPALAQVVQYPHDALRRQGHQFGFLSNAGHITFSSLSGVLDATWSRLKSDRGIMTRWEQALGPEVRTEEGLASLLLRYAVEENPQGVVLFSTTRPDRIPAALQALAPGQEHWRTTLASLLDRDISVAAHGVGDVRD